VLLLLLLLQRSEKRENIHPSSQPEAAGLDISMQASKSMSRPQPKTGAMAQTPSHAHALHACRSYASCVFFLASEGTLGLRRVCASIVACWVSRAQTRGPRLERAARLPGSCE
jgi:hypothetical protein